MMGRIYVSLGVSIVVVALLIPLGLYASRASRRTACLQNLKSIANASRIYSAKWPGQSLPGGSASVQTLLTEGLITQDQTVSPVTGLPLLLASPGCFGDAVTATDNLAVIAYERASEKNGGGCVLFADGHGECLQAPEYEAALAHATNRR